MRSLFGLLCATQILSALSLNLPRSDQDNVNHPIFEQERAVKIDEFWITSPPPDWLGLLNDSTTSPPRNSTRTPIADAWAALKAELPYIFASTIGGSAVGVLVILLICWCCQKRQHKGKGWKRFGRKSDDDIPLTDIKSKKSPRKTDKSKKGPCYNIELAKEYIDSQKWNRGLFDPTHDRCYCSRCYLDTMPDISTAGNARYVIPRGWVRLGLAVDSTLESTRDIWNKWIVTFHGTVPTAAKEIVINRQFSIPGDTLLSGVVLGTRHCNLPNKKEIYTSPTIAYSSMYSVEHDFYSKEADQHFKAKLALQCRQAPETFQVQGETLGANGRRFCQHIPNEELEYWTLARASVVAYGLLLKLEPNDSAM